MTVSSNNVEISSTKISHFLYYENKTFHFTGAVVSLEQTHYRVDEGLSVIQVCANIPFPPINCPVKFPFEVGLTTVYQSPSILYISCFYVMNYICFKGVLDVEIEFDSCEKRKCVSVNVADNLLDESRTLNLSLSRTASLHPRIELHDSTESELKYYNFCY